MGIQASLNALTGAIWGGLAKSTTIAKGISELSKHTKMNKPKELKEPEKGPTVLSEDLEDDLYLPRIGKRPYGQNRYMAAISALRGNEAIESKARATFDPIGERLKEIEELKKKGENE